MESFIKVYKLFFDCFVLVIILKDIFLLFFIILLPIKLVFNLLLSELLLFEYAHTFILNSQSQVIIFFFSYYIIFIPNKNKFNSVCFVIIR